MPFRDAHAVVGCPRAPQPRRGHRPAGARRGIPGPRPRRPVPPRARHRGTPAHHARGRRARCRWRPSSRPSPPVWGPTAPVGSGESPTAPPLVLRPRRAGGGARAAEQGAGARRSVGPHRRGRGLRRGRGPGQPRLPGRDAPHRGDVRTGRAPVRVLHLRHALVRQRRVRRRRATPRAVLLRAAAPLDGLDAMFAARAAARRPTRSVQRAGQAVPGDRPRRDPRRRRPGDRRPGGHHRRRRHPTARRARREHPHRPVGRARAPVAVVRPRRPQRVAAPGAARPLADEPSVGERPVPSWAEPVLLEVDDLARPFRPGRRRGSARGPSGARRRTGRHGRTHARLRGRPPRRAAPHVRGGPLHRLGPRGRRRQPSGCCCSSTRKLQRWLQPGGHADGDANLAGVALREATEETGIEGLRVVLPADRPRHPRDPPPAEARPTSTSTSASRDGAGRGPGGRATTSRRRCDGWPSPSSSGSAPTAGSSASTERGLALVERVPGMTS